MHCLLHKIIFAKYRYKFKAKSELLDKIADFKIKLRSSVRTTTLQNYANSKQIISFIIWSCQVKNTVIKWETSKSFDGSDRKYSLRATVCYFVFFLEVFRGANLKKNENYCFFCSALVTLLIKLL